MNSILIIEDDKEIRGLLQYYLTKDGQYDVTLAGSAEEAASLVRKQFYDCILLDIMLPGIDGMSFCFQLRSHIYCPIIFISCLDDDETIVKAIDMGGDDYLVKPFSKAKLNAYVKANIRRSKMHLQENSDEVSVGELRLLPHTHSVTKNGEQLLLSPTEYELLYHMIMHRGEFLSFESIYQAVWGYDSIGDYRTLFTHILNIRKKIEPDTRNPRYIKTIHRRGYIFSTE